MQICMHLLILENLKRLNYRDCEKISSCQRVRVGEE